MSLKDVKKGRESPELIALAEKQNLWAGVGFVSGWPSARPATPPSAAASRLRQHPPATQVSSCCNKLLLTQDYSSFQIPPGELGKARSLPAPVASPINNPPLRLSFEGTCPRSQQGHSHPFSFPARAACLNHPPAEGLDPPDPHTTISHLHLPAVRQHTPHIQPKPLESSPYLPPILPNSFLTKVWEGSKGPLALRRSTMTLAEGGMHPRKHLLYLPTPQLAIEKTPGLTGGKAGSHFGRKNIFRKRTEWIIWDQSEKQTTEVFTKSVLSPLFPGQPPRVFIFWFPPALPKQCNMHLWYLNEVFLKYSLLNHQPHKLFLKNK